MRVLNVALVTVLALPLIAMSAWRLSGGQVLSVQTNSMRPVFSAGDALLLRPLNHTPQPGQVVSYRSSQQPNVIISHRIQRVVRAKAGYITRGDAVQQADLLVRPYQIVGQPVAVLPLLGTCLHWLRSPVGLVGAIYLPTALILGREVYRLAR